MKSFRLFLAVALLAVVTNGCTKWVAGTHNPEKLKENSPTWGVPQARPVVWGFTGIDRGCTEKDPCPSQEPAK